MRMLDDISHRNSPSVVWSAVTMRPLGLKEPFLSACAHNVVGEARDLLSRGAQVQRPALARDHFNINYLCHRLV